MPHYYRTFFLSARSGLIDFTRLRLLMTSVFKEIGRGRPCSLRNKPHALQSTAPVSSRRHRGVVDVLQFWQIGCVVSLSLAIAYSTGGHARNTGHQGSP
jgi:hypothetical protein